jgi:hypothetical protein
MMVRVIGFQLQVEKYVNHVNPLLNRVTLPLKQQLKFALASGLVRNKLLMQRINL